MQPCRYLLVSPYQGIYWAFHGVEVLVAMRIVDEHAAWSVRSFAWQRSRAKSYWQHSKALWTPFLDYLRSEDIMAEIVYVAGRISLVWPSARFRRVSGLFNWDTVPPTDELHYRFEDFVETLRAGA